MTTIEAASSFHTYSAPRDHGTALIDPPWPRMGSVLRSNAVDALQWQFELAGQPVSELRRRARANLVRSAVQFSRGYRSLPARWLDLATRTPTADRQFEPPLPPILMAGHQPQLFHPGVWFKNFALSTLARGHRALAINLIVDNDLCGAASIRIPQRHGTDDGHPGGWLRTAVPFDRPVAEAVPFEQRRVVDRGCFDSFGSRVTELLADTVPDPCIEQLWPHARAAIARCANLGCALAQSRHALEAEMGLETLEVPLSHLCRGPEYTAFVLSLLAELPRLHECYNRSLAQYRAAHRIRSRAHPVPSLGERDDWFEAPLWIYGDQDPRRRPVWARLHGDALEISDGHQRLVRIRGELDGSRAIEQLEAAGDSEFKLRPRALVTTMYARLILSDLFLHGIGGAKYDQLGDLIIERFYGIQPPRYGVLSATVLLPGAPQSEKPGRAPGEVLAELRDVQFSPERFALQAGLPEPLLERKRRLLQAIPPRGQRRRWHHELTDVNARLSKHLTDVRGALHRELQHARDRQRQAQIGRSREHPFVIFPQQYLRETFARLLPE